MKRSRQQLLKVLLGTGLYLLLKGRERLEDTISDNIRGRSEHSGHLKWILLGVGMGVGVGMLSAPVSGRETRERLSDKVHNIGDRFRHRFQDDRAATGTQGTR